MPRGPAGTPAAGLGEGLEAPGPTHMSGECTVCTCPAYSSLSSMGMSTRSPSFSSSLSMMQERGAAGGRGGGRRRRGWRRVARDHPPLPSFSQARLAALSPPRSGGHARARQCARRQGSSRAALPFPLHPALPPGP